jgi:hypothetical protein
MTGRGYNDTSPKGLRWLLRGEIPMKVKGMTWKKRSLIRGCGGQIRIIIYWLKQWMWIVVSMTDAGFVARWILICYKIWKR